jgi:hypothetical protein
MIDATQRFTENNRDDKASIIVTIEIIVPTTTSVLTNISQLQEVLTVFYFYNGTSPPPGVFDEFNAIPWLTSTVKTMTYPELVFFRL